MDLIKLLGKNLRSVEIVDLFEENDVAVRYEFDRLNEGKPDEYTASVPHLGLEFLFDEAQILRTLFVYVTDQDEFLAADLVDYKLSKFDSIDTAQRYANEGGIEYKNGEAEFLGENREWIRYEYSNHSIHYEFRNKVLSLITLQHALS